MEMGKQSDPAKKPLYVLKALNIVVLCMFILYFNKAIFQLEQKTL